MLRAGELEQDMGLVEALTPKDADGKQLPLRGNVFARGVAKQICHETSCGCDDQHKGTILKWESGW